MKKDKLSLYESIKDFKMKKKPTRCIDPVMKYCQGCEYGYIIYLDDIEIARDLEGCTFYSGCIFGLEDTVPTEQELKEFEEWCERRNNLE